MNKWPKVPLGEVMKQDTNATPVHADREYRNFGIYSFGRGLFAKPPISGATTSAKSLYKVRAGQFIYSRLFAFEGAYGLVGEEFDGCFISNEYPHFDCDSKQIRSDYLVLYFKWQRAWERAATLSTGMGDRRRRIQPEQLLRMEIPLPSLTEQQRQVEHLKALFAKIDDAKRLREEADQQTSLLLGRAVAQAFEKGKNSGWKQATLGGLINDASYGTSEKTCDDESATPILRMGNIQDGQLDKTDLKYLHLAPSIREKLLLSRGDILINRTNSAELVGKSAVFDLDDDYGYASYIIRIKLNRELASPYLVAHYINSPIGRAYMLSEKKQMTGQANVNLATLRAMPIWLPNQDEQVIILREIEQLRTLRQNLRHNQNAASLELKAMLPAILDQAFNGQEQGQES